MSQSAANKDSTPLVSVIITCFNQAAIIEDSIRSVLEQTLEDFECIVVDDGSTDGSVEVVNRIARSDPRIRVITQQNAGVSAARNAGFRVACGEFIQFLDGDDLLRPKKLEIQVAQLQVEPTAGVSCCDHEFLKRDSGEITSYKAPEIERQPLRQMLEDWFRTASLPIHAGVFRRSIWEAEELPFPPDYHGRCEDWVFLVLIAVKGIEFASIPDKLCLYCIEEESFTAGTRGWNAAVISAAAYLEPRIPSEVAPRFFMNTVEATLDRYLQLSKPDVLRSSLNWRLGRSLSWPVFLLRDALRGFILSLARLFRD